LANVLCCSRPTSLHDRGRDSDDDDFRDRDYDVAALTNNMSQAFRFGIYRNDDIEEVIFVSFLQDFLEF
jgi:serine/threonine-protein phosphatase 6 regulatory subunit 3